MNKLWAVLKREYLQRVRARMFVVMTVLGPVVLSLFGIAPALIFSINAGGPVKIAVVDQTGKMYSGLYNSVMDEVEELDSAGCEVRRQVGGEVKFRWRTTNDGDNRKICFDSTGVH